MGFSTKKTITSARNPSVLAASALKTVKGRKESGCFLLEGEKLVSELPPGVLIEALFLCENFVGENPQSPILELAVPTKIIVANNVMKSLADTVSPQGVAAVCRFSPRLPLITKTGRYLLLYETNDPGNLGTIIRTASAAGFDGIFISANSADIFSPKTLRASAGSVFKIPIAENVILTEIITQLKNTGISIYAAALSGAVSAFEAVLSQGFALMIGNEARGLTSELLDKSDFSVKIPIVGKVESLNASVAAGILIYESLRQKLSN